MARTKFCLSLKPRAAYFTHWILPLTDSRLSVHDAVPEKCDHVLEPPLDRATSIIGCSRLRTVHQRKCFLAGRS
jgi:hypothetical protein